MDNPRKTIILLIFLIQDICIYIYNCHSTANSYSNEYFNEFTEEDPRNESVQAKQRNIMLQYFTKAEVKPVGRGGEKVTSPSRCMKF